MKINVNIFLVLMFITGACSSTTRVSEGFSTQEDGSTKDVVNVKDGGKVPYEARVPEYSEGERLAWQEYNVSPLDTIWFDDYLVTGRDTFTYEQAYPKFAYEEYGVTMTDTIWFDNYLVVGADTLGYNEVYKPGRQFWLSIYGPGPEEFEWLTRPRRSATGMMLLEENLVYSGLLDGNSGFNWSYSSPLLSPQKAGIEVTTKGNRNTERPLYTYYMGRPPQVAAPDKTPELRNERERGVLFHISMFSAILMLLAL